MRTYFHGSITKTLASRQVAFVASTSDVDRMGDTVDPRGIVLTNYLRNPVCLRGHDPLQPVARASGLRVVGNALEGFATFPDEDAGSEVSAETYNLIKSGVLSGVSIGFNPIEFEPIAGGGRNYTSIELLEISFVSVPANAAAVITQRGCDSYSRAQRETDIARLKAAADTADRRLIATLDGAHYAHAKAAEIERETLRRSALAYERDPEVQRANRLREIERLRLK